MYSVLVVAHQTERGKELTKEFKDDAQEILAELHDYHNKSKMAQHEIVELTTYTNNLRITDTWKGTTQQLPAHFKEKLCLLDSLVEESNEFPETTCISFLQQAVESIPDLCQVHVMDTVWHQETGSSGTLSYQIYYDLLRSAAYHHHITTNSAIKCCRAYTYLTQEDDGMGST